MQAMWDKFVMLAPLDAAGTPTRANVDEMSERRVLESPAECQRAADGDLPARRRSSACARC